MEEEQSSPWFDAVGCVQHVSEAVTLLKYTDLRRPLPQCSARHPRCAAHLDPHQVDANGFATGHTDDQPS
jgi:hypothetical protein